MSGKKDALVNIADYLTQEIAYAFASKEDDMLFLGDGSSTYGGVNGLVTKFATATAGVFTATGHTTLDTLTATDLTGWMGLLPQYAVPGQSSTVARASLGACFGVSPRTLVETPSRRSPMTYAIPF